MGPERAVRAGFWSEQTRENLSRSDRANRQTAPDYEDSAWVISGVVRPDGWAVTLFELSVLGAFAGGYRMFGVISMAFLVRF